MASDDTTLSAQVNRLNVNEEEPSGTAPSELVTVVDDLLAQLQTKFSNVSAELVGKLDEMSRRLDNLEATIQASNAPQADEGESK
ncbi:hypothetical protein KC367_g4511 [Hortaea werneckii]|uniref:Heat shock factor binding protein 1 n=2 Tax=Hortaea werneckii TaxID=91943 RepID=A0A3M7I8Y2_HORWE|nr:hypothetical protein KC350_g18040 [Hortaea werneckii]OTA37579.1 hypothetical protein BTJ68_02844 [Hortaea werneckii EXF-2000]KAI6790329.1 hypothetical protein KC358_g18033 [Hortaea werneckii]KAI6793284.1 hypothetical protein KC361_g6243 [Hortaea werneckii]KAI6808138.1 hypothetical protein KC342_g18684 [Hortaea werneckii]